MIEYELSMTAPHSHLFEVEIRVPAPDSVVDLVMPTWTPGSYLIREFARNVQDFIAHDGSGLRLSCRKVSKHTWRIEGVDTGAVIVRYRVYANEISVRTSHLDASHGYVNGASVFMYVQGREAEPVRVRVVAPEAWRVATSLHETADNVFLAENYDELVDCPVEIGPHRTIAWMQDGVPHRYAIQGPGEIDETKLEADTRRIIDVCSAMFGGLPYDRYLFILHVVPEGRGGLEHRTSTSLQVPRASLAGAEYESLISLVAHEFFHVWLGKRIRPAPLGPFNYTAENYTRHLWVVEGFTTYYTDLILVRAGLMTPERYLERLGESIARLWTQPGRHRQTLEESSFDAWIRFYRPDSHTPNSQVSYYHKGALVALALDLEIRRASDGERSLDDVMRTLWERYGARDEGFPEDGTVIREAVEAVLGEPADELFAAYVSGVEEIDFDRHLEAVGLAVTRGAAGARVADEGWLGMRLRADGARVRVTHVLEGTPAAEAGVNAGDELVAVDGLRVKLGADGAPVGVGRGREVELALLRRDELVTARAGVGAGWAGVGPVAIVAAEGADAGAGRRRAGWLARGGRISAGGGGGV